MVRIHAVADLAGLDTFFSDSWSAAEKKVIKAVSHKLVIPVYQLETMALGIVMLGDTLTYRELYDTAMGSTIDYTK